MRIIVSARKIAQEQRTRHVVGAEAVAYRWAYHDHKVETPKGEGLEPRDRPAKFRPQHPRNPVFVDDLLWEIFVDVIDDCPPKQTQHQAHGNQFGIVNMDDIRLECQALPKRRPWTDNEAIKSGARCPHGDNVNSV